MPDNNTVSKATFDFLKELEKNNNKEWFEANKATFKSHETAAKLSSGGAHASRSTCSCS